MRTTIDLPDDLMRAAKMRAAEHGESLKEMFTKLLARELESGGGPIRTGRVAVPLVGEPGKQPISVTNADIEAALASDDEKYGR